MTVVGAVLMIISAFLPLYEPTGMFRLIQQNTLIQHDGWILVAAAIAVGATALRAHYAESGGWELPFGFAVLSAAGIAYWATSTDMRTLYPVGADGNADVSEAGVVAAHGIAVYVAGLGVALALVGSLMMRQAEKNPGSAPRSDRELKRKCPDCAEVVLADAKVCKHCGYRFATSA